jgi:hypothetical protein
MVIAEAPVTESGPALKMIEVFACRQMNRH